MEILTEKRYKEQKLSFSLNISPNIAHHQCMNQSLGLKVIFKNISAAKIMLRGILISLLSLIIWNSTFLQNLQKFWEINLVTQAAAFGVP